VAGYVVATRRAGATTTDGTTEAAALAVIALGVVAGMGEMALAAGAGAIVVLLLREKERVHTLVSHLDEPELRAGVQFAVLAVVVLPLLPIGPFFGDLAARPRSLWAIVLLFSGLNFAGFIARRTVGASKGMTIAGAFGGMISSTAVTVNFSRQSRGDPAAAPSLAAGVIAACTVLVPRILLVSAVLNPTVALHLAPALAPMLIVGSAIVLLAWRDAGGDARPSVEAGVQSPLRLGSAMRMALLFQVAMVAMAMVRRFGDDLGLYSAAAILGLTNADALIVSVTRPDAAIAPPIAARAILIGAIASTLLKLAIVASIGRSSYRRRAGTGMAWLALAGGLGLLFA
jgi:uncharacterized membrane protein (DUF4010 family)